MHGSQSKHSTFNMKYIRACIVHVNISIERDVGIVQVEITVVQYYVFPIHVMCGVLVLMIGRVFQQLLHDKNLFLVTSLTAVKLYVI